MSNDHSGRRGDHPDAFHDWLARADRFTPVDVPEGRDLDASSARRTPPSRPDVPAAAANVAPQPPAPRFTIADPLSSTERLTVVPISSLRQARSSAAPAADDLLVVGSDGESRRSASGDESRRRAPDGESGLGSAGESHRPASDDGPQATPDDPADDMADSGADDPSADSIETTMPTRPRPEPGPAPRPASRTSEMDAPEMNTSATDALEIDTPAPDAHEIEPPATDRLAVNPSVAPSGPHSAAAAPDVEGPVTVMRVGAPPGPGVAVWSPPLLGWIRSEPEDGATPDDLVAMVSGTPEHALERYAELAARLAAGAAVGGFVALIEQGLVVLVAGDARVTLDGDEAPDAARRGAGADAGADAATDGGDEGDARGDGVRERLVSARRIDGPGANRCDMLVTDRAARVTIAAGDTAALGDTAVIGQPGLYAGGGVEIRFGHRVELPEDEAALDNLIIALGQTDDPADVLSVVTGRREVPGVVCEREHFNHPRAEHCAVCGLQLRGESARRETRPRPSLGTLVADDGKVHPLDRGYLVGRSPEQDIRVRNRELAPLQLPDPDRLLGRTHAEIRLRDWEVEIIDLGSRNGTAVRRGSGQLKVGQDPTVLEAGDEIHIGGRTITFTSPHQVG